MTLLPNFKDARIPALRLGDPSGALTPPATPVVWAAGGVILALACFGLYRGMTVDASHPAAASTLGVLSGSSAAAVAAATPAVILPRDEQWSALSGPKILEPAAKPAAPASDQSSANDNGSADASAAASNAPPTADDTPKDPLEAVSGAQTAPPVNPAAAATPDPDADQRGPAPAPPSRDSGGLW